MVKVIARPEGPKRSLTRKQLIPDRDFRVLPRFTENFKRALVFRGGIIANRIAEAQKDAENVIARKPKADEAITNKKINFRAAPENSRGTI